MSGSNMNEKILATRINAQLTGLAGLSGLVITLISMLFAGATPILLGAVSIGLLALSHAATQAQQKAARIPVRIKTDRRDR
jgi:hypothetical protein